ncbi:HAD-IA family hydrolase [Pradoshia sp.]
MRYKVILFDLDGTLTDPFFGISQSVQYALRKMGIKVPDYEHLREFIGPPLQETFVQMFQMTELEVQIAITYYRERYTSQGIYENEVYPGVRQLLKLLIEKEYILVIATSKPSIYAERIVSHFGLESYFDRIIGSQLDGGRSNKTEIIQHTMSLYPHIMPTDFIMVGDRMHDIIGAQNAAIDSIAVLYGYGSEAELRHSKPSFLAKSIEELSLLFESFSCVNT